MLIRNALQIIREKPGEGKGVATKALLPMRLSWVGIFHRKRKNSSL